MTLGCSSYVLNYIGLACADAVVQPEIQPSSDVQVSVTSKGPAKKLRVSHSHYIQKPPFRILMSPSLHYVPLHQAEIVSILLQIRLCLGAKTCLSHCMQIYVWKQILNLSPK